MTNPVMPDLNIPDVLRTKIDSLPERKKPLLLSRNKMASILIEEALEQRRAKMKNGQKLARA